MNQFCYDERNGNTDNDRDHRKDGHIDEADDRRRIVGDIVQIVVKPHPGTGTTHFVFEQRIVKGHEHGQK